MIVQQNRIAEFTFYAARRYDDPFCTVTLEAVFTRPDGSQISVPAFWAGENVWKVRYADEAIGIHTFITVCSVQADGGLHGRRGSLEIEPYVGENALYRHGAIVRKAGERYLVHRDGTPFYWLGDTWWMGLTSRLPLPGGFEELAADRVRKGFNAVQIVAGLYPDMPWMDERGRNEAGFPWDETFHAVNPAYFNAADRKIAYLCDQGLIPCIVGCWGYFMKFAGLDVVKRHWKNLIARWGAYPVVWCAAGEANMIYYSEMGRADEDYLADSRRDWNEVVRYMREIDPFGRLVTIHPTQRGHEQITDENLLDLDLLQTGHDSFKTLAHSMRECRAAVERNKLPVINDEVCYEGICGSNYSDVQRYIYLSSFMLGTCGHTYGANGIWQVNTREKPYGVSPHGMSWGDTPWQDAAALPGSSQIARCAKFLTRFDWFRFTYHPEWIERPCTLTDTDGHFVAGIPRKVRVFYKPFWGGEPWGEVRLLGIEPDISYRFLRYNPVTDCEEDCGLVIPEEDGSWRAPRATAFGDLLYALIRADEAEYME